MHRRGVLVFGGLCGALMLTAALLHAQDEKADFARLLTATGAEYVGLRNELLAPPRPLGLLLHEPLTAGEWQERWLARALAYRAEAAVPAEADLARLPAPHAFRYAPAYPLPPPWKGVLEHFRGRADLAPVLVEALLKDTPDGPSVFISPLASIPVSGYWVRQCAASALGDTGDPEPVQPLLWAVSQKEAERGWLRTAACFGLLKLGDAETVELLRHESAAATSEVVRDDLAATATSLELRLQTREVLAKALQATGPDYLAVSRQLVAPGRESRQVLLVTALQSGPEAALLFEGAWLRRSGSAVAGHAALQKLARVLQASLGQAPAPDPESWRKGLVRGMVPYEAAVVAEVLLKDRGQRDSLFLTDVAAPAVPSAWARACAAVGLSLAWPRGGGSWGPPTAPVGRDPWDHFNEGRLQILAEALLLDDEPFVHAAVEQAIVHMVQTQLFGGTPEEPVPLPEGQRLLATARAKLSEAAEEAQTDAQRRRLHSALRALEALAR